MNFGCRAAARLARETEAYEPGEIPGVSPELLAAQSCLLACRVVASCGTCHPFGCLEEKGEC